MKKLGIIFLLLLFCIPSIAYTGFYQGRGANGFCDRIFTYIKSEPCHRKMPTTCIPKPSLVHLPPRPCIKLTRDLPNINAVYIRGGINLQIIGGKPCNKISLKQYYDGLTIKVSNNAIYISNNKKVDCNQNPRPCLKLYIDHLQELVIAGDSCICGCNLNTACGLSISHCGSGSVCINGPTNLVRVMNTGSAIINIPNVASDHLHILATRTGITKLFGSTGLLLVRAFQQAVVDTRLMCSQTAMVQATDCALVTVHTFGSLQAFANGTSNIYYYTRPGEIIKHHLLSGNVFQMGGY